MRLRVQFFLVLWSVHIWLLVVVFSSRRRHTRSLREWSSDVCSSDLGYPRAWWDGHYRRAGRLVYSWQVGEIPKGWTIDHTCRRRWCMETVHMEPLPRAEHARREAERRRLATAAEPSAAAAPEQPASSFAIALFAGID